MSENISEMFSTRSRASSTVDPGALVNTDPEVAKVLGRHALDRAAARRSGQAQPAGSDSAGKPRRLEDPRRGLREHQAPGDGQQDRRTSPSSYREKQVAAVEVHPQANMPSLVEPGLQVGRLRDRSRHRRSVLPAAQPRRSRSTRTSRTCRSSAWTSRSTIRRGRPSTASRPSRSARRTTSASSTPSSRAARRSSSTGTSSTTRARAASSSRRRSTTRATTSRSTSTSSASGWSTSRSAT